MEIQLHHFTETLSHASASKTRQQGTEEERKKTTLLSSVTLVYVRDDQTQL